MLYKRVEALKNEDETDRVYEKFGIVIDRSLSEKKQHAEFMKEASKLISKGEASAELQITYVMMESFDEFERKKHGERIKMGRALAKAKREQSA